MVLHAKLQPVEKRIEPGSFTVAVKMYVTREKAVHANNML